MVQGNDLSYGIYIFHMPIFNFYLAMGLMINTVTFLAVCLSVVFVAFLSWKYVEKPALKLKKVKTLSI
jgi:peptidoglycan/LPS O-acetylase OafA/YrhL